MLIFSAALLSLSGCLPPSDVAFKMAGQLTDEKHNLYDVCYVEGKQKDDVVYQSKISGDYSITVVFGAVSSAPLDLTFSCDGSEETYTYQLNRIPRPFGEVLDIGNIILKGN
jgi:hypothetical protein